MKFRIGDQVIVITGREKGKTGTVTKILKKEERVLVEGVNQQVKHAKGRPGMAGERIEFFAPVPVSNVAIVDPKTKKASRIGYKIDKDGQKVRISKASGEVITISKEKPKKEAAPTKSEPKTIKA